MEKLTLSEIAQFTNGKQSGNIMISNVSIDSRNMKEDCLFIGIKGENFDGNDYLEDAILKGAKAVLTTKEIYSIPNIKVEDTGKAFLDMAKGYKERIIGLKTVGITGSVGKTTTKEMLHSILSEVDSTHKTDGNFNNHIGVPLTLLNLTKSHKYAVVEMGMSGKGEIELLSKAVCPDIGVITNIGESHIEHLGSKEEIAKAKLEILKGLKGTIVLNGNEPLLRDLDIENEIIYFGIEGDDLDVSCKDIRQYAKYTKFVAVGKDFEIEIKINTFGRHNVANALGAITVAKLLGATDEQVQAGLYAFQNTGMRQNIFDYDGYTVIEDCYNASPDSMKAALSVLNKTKSNKKIAVLGAMAELGDFSYNAHKEILQIARESADIVYLVGDAWRKVELQNAEVFENRQVLTLKLKQNVKEGDAVLFKGSRAEKMEEVLKMLVNEEK
ncbi:MAG: UDP-N-acetylmuramoyl-tripeptide--D-alanyl-D-alanine ligase [Clostridia bacterium]